MLRILIKFGTFCTQYTVHSTQYTAHSTQCTVHSTQTLYTQHKCYTANLMQTFVFVTNCQLFRVQKIGCTPNLTANIWLGKEQLLNKYIQYNKLED